MQCRHTTRFVLIYVSFLPLALWASLDWATIIVAPTIALLLAGIENIGVMIENPMKVMPMAAFCTVIHANVLGIGSAWAHGDEVSPSFDCPTPRCRLAADVHVVAD